MTAMLETHGLQVFYRDFQALFGIDFSVEEGETVAIIGANGAGKSSFLAALSGMAATQPRQILLDGRPIGGTRPSEMVKLGIAKDTDGYIGSMDESRMQSFLEKAEPIFASGGDVKSGITPSDLYTNEFLSKSIGLGD